MKRLAFTALSLGAALAIGAFSSLQSPYRGFDKEVILDIPRGAGTRQIARQLAEAGVVRSQWHFLAARALQPSRALQAGEYQFLKPATAFEVYARIARGDIFYFEVTFPEGSNLFDMAHILESKGILPGAQFIDAARDPSLIKDLVPEAPSLEGYLFPATYRLTRHTTARQLTRDMTMRFRRAWKELNPTAPVHFTVTLASLVEKETAVGGERPLVASVFHNRLVKGMKLDCDPTTIYAALLERRYRGTIYRSDLDSRNPYNTYQHAGLPPGPIANPGMKSLAAALRPARTAHLYFVARPDGSGGHVFSSAIDAHNKAVAEYRRGQRKTNH
ncbi:MAG: endolytic transglycosylase MltG [Bryobacterales bacterium]|nr:endolytic transglycosylase MltG [Bryobacterales bacterium]